MRSRVHCFCHPMVVSTSEVMPLEAQIIRHLDSSIAKSPNSTPFKIYPYAS
jgi:hypothetical protein